jgi:hypothetical protein
MIKYFLSSLFLLIYTIAFSQIGGDNTFEFLNLTTSARVAAMGGKCNSIKDDDLSLAMENPALISKQVSGQLTLGAVKFFDGVNYGDVAYAKDFEKYGTFAAGIHYVSYGSFTRADNSGTITGDFNAADYALQVAWGKAIDSIFSVGATLKGIYSHLDSYTATGLAVDIGANYYNPRNLIGASIVVKNFGRQLKSYTSNNVESLPIEIQAGASVRVKKAPFRFSLVAQHLEKFNMSYTDPNEDGEIDPLTGETKTSKITFGDKLLRHVIFGGEILLSKNFHLRAGYNFQRRKEMTIDTKMSTVGFSWGLAIILSKFQFSYSRVKYHLEGPANYLTINARLSDLFMKKKTGEGDSKIN